MAGGSSRAEFVVARNKSDVWDDLDGHFMSSVAGPLLPIERGGAENATDVRAKRALALA